MTTTIDPTIPAPVVRVERGHLSGDELAALTAVLLSRATARSSGAPADRPAIPAVPLWDRPERHTFYRLPVSWRR